MGLVLRSTSALISFGLAVLLFATVYKVLPSVRLAWRDVLAGALITAVLFTAGKFAIGLYLGSSTVASTYGAAGSVIVVLLWVYYSAEVFLFGAELTRGYACRFGSRRGIGGPMCCAVIGAPDWIRTSDLQLRRLPLYPTELRARCPGGGRK